MPSRAAASPLKKRKSVRPLSDKHTGSSGRELIKTGMRHAELDGGVRSPGVYTSSALCRFNQTAGESARWLTPPHGLDRRGGVLRSRQRAMDGADLTELDVDDHP